MTEERRDSESSRGNAEYEAMLRALPRATPDPGFEDRTVHWLREAQLLAPPRRPARRMGWRPTLAAAAAALLFFSGGVAVGRWTGPAQAGEAIVGETTAMELQRAASAYLAALQSLQSPSVTEGGRQTGLEIGVNTLEQAASELVRAAPQDRLAGEIIRAIHVSRTSERPAQASRDRHIVWF